MTTRGKILVVDDEAELMSALCDTLIGEGFAAVGETSAGVALQRLARESFDLILTDLKMPQTDGLDLLRAARGLDPDAVVIIMTGHGTVPTAVEAMKTGAFDYLLKPFKLQTLLPILSRGLEVRRLRTENTRLRQWLERVEFESPRYQLVGQSPALKKIIQLIERVAPTNSTVLIC